MDSRPDLPQYTGAMLSPFRVTVPPVPAYLMPLYFPHAPLLSGDSLHLPRGCCCPTFASLLLLSWSLSTSWLDIQPCRITTGLSPPTPPVTKVWPWDVSGPGMANVHILPWVNTPSFPSLLSSGWSWSHHLGPGGCQTQATHLIRFSSSAFFLAFLSRRATVRVGIKWPPPRSAHAYSLVWLHIERTEIMSTGSINENPRSNDSNEG